MRRSAKTRLTGSQRIDPSARISPRAILGSDVVVGPFTIIGDNVSIGENTVIQDHCSIGASGSARPLTIGRNSTIRSHSVIYCGSTFGDGLETGHHVVIRENSRVGLNMRIGNFSDLEGDCVIGDFCRLHGYAHVGKGSRIGDFAWIYSLVTLTNDPLPPSSVLDPVTVGDGCVICVGATLLPGTVLGRGAFVSAGSIAHGHVPDGAVIHGPDGCAVNHVSSLMHPAKGLRHPWMRHYTGKYPQSAKRRLERLQKDILASRNAPDTQI